MNVVSLKLKKETFWDNKTSFEMLFAGSNWKSYDMFSNFFP